MKPLMHRYGISVSVGRVNSTPHAHEATHHEEDLRPRAGSALIREHHLLAPWQSGDEIVTPSLARFVSRIHFSSLFLKVTTKSIE